MGWRSWVGMTETRSNPLENPQIPLSASYDEFLRFFGQLGDRVQLPPVTKDSALEVPAVLAAVTFLSRTMASLPLHVFKEVDGKTVRETGDLDMLLNEAPNPEWSSEGWRRYMWSQFFTGGRALTWIERQNGPGSKIVALWPIDASKATVARVGGRKVYRAGGKEYPAADVIDLPFLLKDDQLGSYGPIWKGRKAIALAIAMNDFASTFFAGGGVPPLALEGPLPQGTDAFKRAQADINRAIDLAKKAGTPFFGMPPGHQLKAIGIDPDKGQMTEARLFQTQEIARTWGLPPVFIQDLSHGTFTNTEQQDLQLVKHNVGDHCKVCEDELNLKLFGQRRRARSVKHNLDGKQRGDFKTRIEGIARAIQTAQLTPNEARALEDRPALPEGDRLYIQGATVPLGTQPLLKTPKDDGEPVDDDTGGKADA